MSSQALGASRLPFAPSRVGAAGVAARSAVILLLLGVVLLPAARETLAYNATGAVCFAIVGLSMNLLVGYTGQLSLGHQGFFGVGAMVAANVAASGVTPADPLPFALAIATATLVCAAIALLLGVVALRVTGLYLALLTLVFGATVTLSVLGISALNGRSAGVKANRPQVLHGQFRYYLLCVLVLAAVFYLDRRLIASKAGRAMLATKDNERAAEAFGINVVSTKLLAFGLSGALAGLGGALIVFLPQTFSQKDYVGPVGFNLALTFVVVAVVGGLGNRTGVMIASLFFGLLDPIMASLFKLAGLQGYYQAHQGYLPGLIGAVLLLDTVVRRPGGLGDFVSPVSRWLGGSPFTLHDPNGGANGEVAADVRA